MKVIDFLKLEMADPKKLTAGQAAQRRALEEEDARIGDWIAHLEVPGILALGFALYVLCSLLYFGFAV